MRGLAGDPSVAARVACAGALSGFAASRVGTHVLRVPMLRTDGAPGEVTVTLRAHAVARLAGAAGDGAAAVRGAVAAALGGARGTNRALLQLFTKEWLQVGGSATGGATGRSEFRAYGIDGAEGVDAAPLASAPVHSLLPAHDGAAWAAAAAAEARAWSAGHGALSRLCDDELAGVRAVAVTAVGALAAAADAAGARRDAASAALDAVVDLVSDDAPAVRLAALVALNVALTDGGDPAVVPAPPPRLALRPAHVEALVGALCDGDSGVRGAAAAFAASRACRLDGVDALRAFVRGIGGAASLRRPGPAVAAATGAAAAAAAVPAVSEALLAVAVALGARHSGACMALLRDERLFPRAHRPLAQVPIWVRATRSCAAPRLHHTQRLESCWLVLPASVFNSFFLFAYFGISIRAQIVSCRARVFSPARARGLDSYARGPQAALAVVGGGMLEAPHLAAHAPDYVPSLLRRLLLSVALSSSAAGAAPQHPRLADLRALLSRGTTQLCMQTPSRWGRREQLHDGGGGGAAGAPAAVDLGDEEEDVAGALRAAAAARCERLARELEGAQSASGEWYAAVASLLGGGGGGGGEGAGLHCPFSAVDAVPGARGCLDGAAWLLACARGGALPPSSPRDGAPVGEAALAALVAWSWCCLACDGFLRVPPAAAAALRACRAAAVRRLHAVGRAAGVRWHDDEPGGGGGAAAGLRAAVRDAIDAAAVAGGPAPAWLLDAQRRGAVQEGAAAAMETDDAEEEDPPAGARSAALENWAAAPRLRLELSLDASALPLWAAGEALVALACGDEAVAVTLVCAAAPPARRLDLEATLPRLRFQVSRCGAG